ncbi:MAG: HAMP domain-containing histidine kinase [Lachnospiraceae bacterium]|nr:HAMP domain-containing histidine kinase [Lachnospiraceae bacterium]
MSFVITCSMILFFHYFMKATDIKLSADNITMAAIMTFGNVVFIAALCTLIDWIRRRITVGRPVKKILEATDKIIEGDFSVRITNLKAVDVELGFRDIIDNINKMAAELSSVETLRTDFISNVSHELKTPLAVIQNYATILQDDSLSDDERKEYLKIIQDSSKNLAGLITNILKLNKLEKQQIYPDNKRYNLSEQVCECLIGFESVWEDKNIEIETDIEDDIYVKADAEILSLVWNNLFSNAFKFTEQGGSVGVSIRRENDKAYVSVKDTGCGMDAETGKHIFEKFYQGDTSHATKGNGLGLALVKKVIDISGGEISVDSEVGRGSTFTVALKTD